MLGRRLVRRRIHVRKRVIRSCVIITVGGRGEPIFPPRVIKNEGLELSVGDSDAELVRRARSGDTSAFEILFRRYQKPIYNMLYRMVRSPEDAADLTQDTFVRAFAALPSLRDETTFGAWLRQIAVNMVRNRYKRAAKVRMEPLREVVVSDEGETLAKELTDTAPGPEKLAEDAELRDVVEKAVAGLSDDHRLVVVLHHLEHMQVADIAKQLGISVGTVKSRLARAREQLYKKLRTYVESRERLG